MTKILYNYTNQSISLSDVTGAPEIVIDAYGSADLEDSWRSYQIAASDQLIEYLGLGISNYQLYTDDGYHTVSSAINAIRNYYTPQAFPTSSFNRIQVEAHKPTGQSLTTFSHDFTDPTTWYYDSYRVIDAYLHSPNDDGVLYRSCHGNWIDLHHGKVTKEEFIIANDLEFSNGPFYVDLYVNNVLKQEGYDYSIDYKTGEVFFQWPNPFVSDWYFNQGVDGRYLGCGPLEATDVVRCSYSYEDGSTFYIRPRAGKVLHITDLEVQFSHDILIESELKFELWAYAPAGLGFPLGTKICVPSESRSYRGARDYINEGRQGVGVISSFGGNSTHGGRGAVNGFMNRGVRHSVGVFPFNYINALSLRNSLGMEIRISLSHNRPYHGEYATVTIYGEETDE